MDMGIRFTLDNQSTLFREDEWIEWLIALLYSRGGWGYLDDIVDRVARRVGSQVRFGFEKHFCLSV